VAKVFELTAHSPQVEYLKQNDRRLAKVLEMVGDISYTVHEDSYAFLVHEIVEQMLSAKAGAKIFERLVSACGGVVTPSAISALSFEEIRETGVSNAKAEYIQKLTQAVADGTLVFSELEGKEDSEIIKALTAIRGVGTWTAKMYLIFVLNRQNVLPFEDGAFLQTYRWMYKTDDTSPASIKKRCKKWSPYASVAARFMYRALDMGLTKQEFHLFK